MRLSQVIIPILKGWGDGPDTCYCLHPVHEWSKEQYPIPGSSRASFLVLTNCFLEIMSSSDCTKHGLLAPRWLTVSLVAVKNILFHTLKQSPGCFAHKGCVMCGGSEWRCISLSFSVHDHFKAQNPRQPKTSKKMGIALEVWSGWKMLSGVGFFDMANDPLASSLTPVQRCSARTTPWFWGSSAVGALRLFPCSGKLWFSWRFHDGNFIRHVLEEQHWRTLEGGERIIHSG